MKNHCYRYQIFILIILWTIKQRLGFKTFIPAFHDTHFKPIKNNRLMNFNRHGFCRVLLCTNGSPLTQITKVLLHLSLIKEIPMPKILLLPDNKTIIWLMNVELKETPVSHNALELVAAAINELCREESSSVILKDLKNQKNETALHIAIHEKNEHIIKLLLSGSNLESSQKASVYFLTQHDNNNDTPLKIVHGSNSSNNSKDDSLSNRTLTNIL